MAKRKPAAFDRRKYPFGDVDGEKVDLVAAKLSATVCMVDRRFEEGERVLLLVEGVVGTPTFTRDGGKLTRVHRVAVEKIAEPVDHLADEVQAFVDQVEEKRTGQPKLPMDQPPADESDEEPPSDPDAE
jgi:hypothetical protein